MNRLACLVLLATEICACSEDGSKPAPDGSMPLACGADGAGVVNGTIDGVGIGPVARVNYRPLSGPEAGFAGLLIDESPGGCNDGFTTGEHLMFTWCDPPSTTLTLHAPDMPDTCPSAFARGLIEDASQRRDVAAAIDGTVTLTRIDTSCVMGSFSGTFRDARGGTAVLGGSFAATVCPP